MTHWRVLARYPGFTHVECRLETGRTHQIRVHLASIGHPLLGDVVYGSKKPVPGPGRPVPARPAAAVHPSLHWTACGAGVSPPRLVPGCTGPALPPELTAPPRSFSQGGVFSPAPHGRHRIEGCKTWWKRGCRAGADGMGRPAGPAEHPGHLSAVPGSPHRGHRPLLGHPLPGSAEPFSPSSLERTSPEPDLSPARLAVSALVVGSLSYFFLLSLETLCTARSQGRQPVPRPGAMPVPPCWCWRLL